MRNLFGTTHIDICWVVFIIDGPGIKPHSIVGSHFHNSIFCSKNMLHQPVWGEVGGAASNEHAGDARSHHCAEPVPSQSHWFFFFFDWAISVVLSSESLMFSSVIFILLLSLSSESLNISYYISQFYHFHCFIFSIFLMKFSIFSLVSRVFVIAWWSIFMMAT